jgi:hypothetical protein
MEASMHPDPSPAMPAPAADLIGEGRGLLRLSLMVDTVFDRLTSVGDEPQEPKPAG